MDFADVGRTGKRLVDHPVLGPLNEAPTIEITFDGRSIAARADDTVAVALLAVGARVFRTMPKTGEQRGGYCFVGRCSDCLVVIDGEPNQMACRIQVREGMRIQRQVGIGTGTQSGEASS